MQGNYNCSRVARNFSRSAKSYAMAGSFQKLAAQRLYELIGRECDKPAGVSSVLELGCGTGFLTIGLINLFPEAGFVVSDISEKMLEKCRGNIVGRMEGAMAPPPRFECYDIAEAHIEKHYDLIISALAFQWIRDLNPVLENIQSRLRPGGKLIFSTLLKGTFSRLHEVFDKLSIPYPGPALLGRGELENICGIFPSCVIRVSRHVERHPDVMAFLKQVQLTGAKNASGNPVNIRDMRRILRCYSELENESGLEVDYELAEVVCE